jgi:hypothetical protein
MRDEFKKLIDAIDDDDVLSYLYSFCLTWWEESLVEHGVNHSLDDGAVTIREP